MIQEITENDLRNMSEEKREEVKRFLALKEAKKEELKYEFEQFNHGNFVLNKKPSQESQDFYRTLIDDLQQQNDKKETEIDLIRDKNPLILK